MAAPLNAVRAALDIGSGKTKMWVNSAEPSEHSVCV
jgi:hypothetical protein